MDNKKIYIVDIPELMEEWDWNENNKENLFPDKLTHGSTKKVNWICVNNHRFKARIDHRTIMKSNCPYCSGKKAIIGENDLKTKFPNLLKEWDYDLNKGIKPEELLSSSNKKVYWICKYCGYKWKTSISHRTVKHTGCPQCARLERTNTKNKNLVYKKGSLAETNPELLDEWDYKNNIVSPTMITAGSSKKVKWIGKNCNHEWEAKVNNRVRGEKCPICTSRVVLKGYNDLESNYPKIAKEWHPTLNNGKFPYEYSKKSEKKVWWICSKCNNPYNTSIYSRTALKTNCPICANKTVIGGINDLKTTHPEILKEWNYNKNLKINPTEIVSGSNNKIWWICDQGHEWEATVSSRLRGRNCPECAKKIRAKSRKITYLSKNGSLQDKSPELEKEWNYNRNENLTPDKVNYGSSQKVWWICDKGHEWQASVNSRVRGNGCPICAKELSTSYPEQILFYYFGKVTEAYNRFNLYGKELDIYLPKFNVGIEYNGKYYHSNRIDKDKEKVSYFQKKGIIIYSINESDNDKIIQNNIFISYKDKEYLKLKWVIEYISEQIGLPQIDIDIKRDHIKIYENYINTLKSNSLAEKYPWTIEEWNYEKNGKLTPYHISYGSNKKVYWKCKKCSYEWEAVANTRKKSGCPCCANKVVVKGINDFLTLYPYLEKEWDYKKNDKQPSEYTYGSKKKVWWICDNKHSWQESVYKRIKGSKCPFCK